MLERNICIGFLILLQSTFYWSQEEHFEIEEFKQISENLSLHDTVRIQALTDWDELIYVSDAALDIELNEKVIQIAEKQLKNQSLLHPKELVYYKRALSHASNIIGINYDDKGNYAEASVYYYKALKLAEEVDDSVSMGAIANNIGLVHEAQGDQVKAREFFEKALHISQGQLDTTGVIGSLNNIGNLLTYEYLLDSAIVYYRQALDLAKEIKSYYQLASTLENIGVAWERKDQFDSALVYYHHAEKIARVIEDWDAHSNVLYNIGMIHVQRNEFPLGIQYCSEGYDISQANEANFNAALCLQCLHRAYKGNKEFEKALWALEQADTLKEMLTDEEQIRTILQQEASYDYEKKMYADSVDNAKAMEVSRLQSEAEKEASKNTLLSLVVILGLVLIFGIYSYFKFKQSEEQKKIIQKQKVEADAKNEIIEHQNKEITDSINYAQLIQTAVLPQLRIEDMVQDSFVLFQPKDVVSGDFFWLEKRAHFQYFAVADCTGHGIPGAFISMIGTILLNEIFNSKKLEMPDKILDELSRLVRLTLTDGEGNTMKDGMDISFAVLDSTSMTLYYAGANNPIWIVSAGTVMNINETEVAPVLQYENLNLFEQKADKQPVGKFNENSVLFNLHKIQLQEGDRFYLFSDGFADQFGGAKGKKFMYKPFKQKLLELSFRGVPMSDQKKVLSETYVEWKGSLDQVDDVCIIGVRV